jgi:hypothetical protein
MWLQTYCEEKEYLSERRSVRSNGGYFSAAPIALPSTAQQFCSFSLGGTLSSCSGIGKTIAWKKGGR